MAKALRCRDLGIECDEVILAETEEELLAEAAEHVLGVHGVDVTGAQMLEQLKAAIHTAA